MKKIFKIFLLLFKNYSPLRIYQIIETQKQILKGLSLEFGASETWQSNLKVWTPFQMTTMTRSTRSS